MDSERRFIDIGIKFIGKGEINLAPSFGTFGGGVNGYTDYKVYKELQKGESGGRRQATNSGCLSSVILVLIASAIMAYFLIS